MIIFKYVRWKCYYQDMSIILFHRSDGIAEYSYYNSCHVQMFWEYGAPVLKPTSFYIWKNNLNNPSKIKDII